MRRLLLAFTIVGLLALAPVMRVEAGAGPAYLVGDLSGANEVPPADPADSGFGAATLDPVTGEVCFALTLFTIDPSEVILAHIHEAEAGVNGPVVVDFDFPSNGLTNCVSADPGVVADIIADPAGYYYNVHTTDFPGGAVRGQLTMGGGTPVTDLAATLDGANEVPPVDTDATGDATVAIDEEGQVCFDVEVRDIGPVVAAHIHEAPAGVDGPIVVDLHWDLFDGLGCVAADLDLAQAIAGTPEQYYVNIHTEAFPDGEIRGQLQGPPEPSTTAAPTTASTAGGGSGTTPARGTTSPARAVSAQPSLTG
jgi:hypothetical protein